MNKPEGLRHVELKNLSLRDLQARGMENPANLLYRKEVASRIAKSANAKKAFLYDEISGSNSSPWLINNMQRYERTILSGLLMATGFEKGAVTIVAGLPAVAEINSARTLKKRLEQDLDKKVDYGILFEHEGSVVDLMTINDDDYNRVNDSFTRKVVNGDYTHFGVNYHANVAKHHISTTLLPNEKALVMPFIPRNEHNDMFAQEIESGKVVLPKIPDMDKAHNTFLLREHGFKHIPEMIIIGANGKEVDSYEALLSDEVTNKGREKNPKNVSIMAKGILEGIDKLREGKGLKAYVFLDPERSGGSGNLDPGIEDYAKIYDNNVETKVKQKILERAIDKMFKDTLPPRSIVEEFIEQEEREGEKLDYGISGQVVDRVFLPTSISLCGTTNGKFNRLWVSKNPEAIGEDPAVWKKLLTITAEAADIYSKYSGYTGDFALDIFKRKDGSLVVHDFNYRRGGASAPETVLIYLPTSQSVLFKARVKIPIDKPISFEEKVALNEKTNERLLSNGMIPCETSSKNDPVNERGGITFNILMLTDKITGPGGEQLARDQHYKFVTEKVRKAMQLERKIIQETIYSAPHMFQSC